jgi:pimeloyl-ACP methyl ester carboxylesterase
MEQCRELRIGNQRIAATIHLPEQTPAPGVVMCHGFTGHRIEAHFLFVKAARAFCEAGLNVLRFDFRGSGESDGLFREMTIGGEIEDALVALEALRSEPTVQRDRVGLLGLSLGGLVASCAAGRAGDVRALALWSAVADLEEIARSRWEVPADADDIAPDFVREIGPHEIGDGFARDSLRIKPLKEIAGHPGPVLVVHGTNDQSVPLGDAHRYMDAIPSANATLRVIEGADHTFSTVALEHEVIGLTRDWLIEHL